MTPYERSVILIITIVLLFACFPKAWFEKSKPVEKRANSSDSSIILLTDTTIRFPLDPNLASPEMLQLVPGIGPKMAARIVSERTRTPFHSAADFVDRVRGIGPSNWERIAPYLKIATTQPGGAK